MSLHEHHNGQQILTRLRDRDLQFNLWLSELRDSDPIFAQASVLAEDGWGEWQAAVYLLTGCHQTWKHFGSHILAEGSIAAVIDELNDGRRGWSSGEHTILRWAAHFWNIGATDVQFPCGLDENHFRRWVNACHLYNHTPPEPSIHRGRS